MEILLGLLAAAAYGTSDFAAGLGSRRIGAAPVAVVGQSLGLLTAGIAVLLFPGNGAAAGPLVWGAISGIGSCIGLLMLYRGLALGQMSIVSTLSAVITAVVPAIVGLALGDYLSVPAEMGLFLALPAIALVAWQRNPTGEVHSRAGLIEGISSGVGFALLFIALDQAGTRNGAWPLIPSQAVSALLVLPFARGSLCQARSWASAAVPMAIAGVLGGVATLLFLAATERGQLAIVAVLTALYPAVTILLARIVLAERWSRLQAFGLLLAAAAVALISFG